MGTLINRLLYALTFVLVMFSLANRLLDESTGERRPPPPGIEAPEPGEALRGPYARRRPLIEPAPLAPPDRWDPAIVVEADQPPHDSVGSAFAVTAGVWLTARHVVDGCARVGIVQPEGFIRAVGRILNHPEADLALLRTARSGPALKLGDSSDLKAGIEGFAVGYPSGAPGEATGVLIGRGRKREKGRFRRFDAVEPVLIWAEKNRRPARLDSLGGLSGGPMLAADGRVLGVMEASSLRRGRMVTSQPGSAELLFRRSGTTPVRRAARLRLHPSGLTRTADRLREQRSVVLVVCDAR